MTNSIAYFITPHGFGHAARAAAVLLALEKLRPDVSIDIYTKVPQWFFEESRLKSFRYHEILTDIGLAQDNAFEENLPETARRLEGLLPYRDEVVTVLSRQLLRDRCALVICDIAPLGIAVAAQAGIPSLLVENFTWDWIYKGYPQFQDALKAYVAILEGWFARADFHVQTIPVCSPAANPTLVSNPVSRPPVRSRAATRQQLGIAETQRAVLLTMGGVEGAFLLNELAASAGKDVAVIAPGAAQSFTREGNLIKLPHHHGLYHPDLVNAADAVIGKLGYSTLAECYTCGAPFGFIPRASFPESPPMAQFAATQMPGLPIAIEDVTHPARLQQTLTALFDLPRRTPEGPNGAVQIAELIDRQILR